MLEAGTNIVFVTLRHVAALAGVCDFPKTMAFGTPEGFFQGKPMETRNAEERLAA